MRKELLIFGSPAIKTAEIEEVIAVMQSGWLGSGPKVAQFERDFAEYKGVEHTVALNSCTAALHLSILAAGIWGRRCAGLHYRNACNRHAGCGYESL